MSALSGGFSWRAASEAPPAFTSRLFKTSLPAASLQPAPSRQSSAATTLRDRYGLRVPGAEAVAANVVEDSFLAVHACELRIPRIEASSYFFTRRSEEVTAETLGPPTPIEVAAERVAPARKHDRYTRLKPPGDSIKLADRLQVLLEPPLELLLENQCLEFPLRPFPFQMEGVAFLYPRQAALLADEMGLG
ncbi:MAG TPA: hypothetical protein VGJ26_13710, partial [Pirellulales bacterium]